MKRLVSSALAASAIAVGCGALVAPAATAAPIQASVNISHATFNPDACLTPRLTKDVNGVIYRQVYGQPYNPATGCYPIVWVPA